MMPPVGSGVAPAATIQLYVANDINARYTAAHMIRLLATVEGKVQGVFYRAYVVDAATELSLVGYIKNNSNQTVEVVAEGPTDVLKEFVEHLHEGSLQSEVSGVAVEWGTATGKFDEFSIRV
jgi:acylphosphatase